MDSPRTPATLERVHALKTLRPFFADVLAGRKRAELRVHDRDFKVGDTLRLLELDEITQELTGRYLDARVTHLFRGGSKSLGGLQEGSSMLSIAPLRTGRFWGDA